MNIANYYAIPSISNVGTGLRQNGSLWADDVHYNAAGHTALFEVIRNSLDGTFSYLHDQNVAGGFSYVGGGKMLPKLLMKTGSARGMRAVECGSCGSSFRTDLIDTKMMKSSGECYDALKVVYSKGFNFTMDHKKVGVQSTKRGSILVSRLKLPAHGAMVGFMRSYTGFGVATAFISTEKDHSAKLCRKCLPHAITLNGAWTQKLSLVEFIRVPMCPPESNGLSQVYLHIITGQGCSTSEKAVKDQKFKVLFILSTVQGATNFHRSTP